MSCVLKNFKPVSHQFEKFKPKKKFEPQQTHDVQGSIQGIGGGEASIPQKKFLSLQYIRNYNEKKIMQTRQVSAHEVSFPCLRTLYDKEHDHDENIK